MNPKPASARYRRRNRWPILVVVLVLLAGGIVVWSDILKPAPPLATGCNAPGPAPSTSSPATSSPGNTSPGNTSTGTSSPAASSPASDATSTGTTGATGSRSTSSATAATSTSTSQIHTTLGEFVDPNKLAATRPADPSEIPLKVLNASTVIGQAKSVTDELRDAGFTSILQQSNDPLYPASDLQCYGEIRYGYAGLAEARTVLIVAPCAQLVRDDRQDNSVDLALGKLYQITPVSKKVRDELTQIKNAAAPPPVIEGQTVSVRPVPTIPPLPSRAGCPG